MRQLSILSLICVLLSAATASGAAAPIQKRTGAISGRVLSDDGQPVVNASVSLRVAGLTQSTPRNTATDEKGEFRFDDLSPATFVVTAQKPGYVHVAQPNDARYYRLGDVATITMVRGGVITGSVTTATGDPVIAMRVYAMRVGDEEGRKLRSPAISGVAQRVTDDRGIYRIYGLLPGRYIVVANGTLGYFSPLGSEFEDETPTYYPSSTRDTAAEVMVQSGQELTGIDIRYRAERGYSISGTITGAEAAAPRPVGASISLRHAASGAIHSSTFVQPFENIRAFAFHGVPNGDYEIVAQSNVSPSEGYVSSPRRVSVKGADVTGLEVALTPTGSISGRVAIERLSEASRTGECKNVSHRLPEEAVVAVRRVAESLPPASKQMQPNAPEFARDSSPDEKGEFMSYWLTSGLYRMEARLPADDLYVRAMALPAPSSNPALTGIALKSGEHVKNLTITISEGAAVLSGRVAPAQEGAALPERLRLHLVPAEREQAENVLRYFEAPVQADGAFTVGNLAPGRYWLLAVEVAYEEYDQRASAPAAWDAAKRGMLRQKAEAANSVIELQPCQRVSNHDLRYAPVAQANPARRK